MGAAQSFGPWAERGGGTGRAALKSCDLVLFWKQSKHVGVKLRGWEDDLKQVWQEGRWQGRVPGARQGRRSETWGKGGTWE